VTDYSESAAQAFADINGKSTTIHKSLNQILDNISEVAIEAEKVAAYSQRISSASEKMNTAYDNLDSQRESVSSEMEKLEDVVALSRNGIDEIKIGAEDIVERMLEVNELSSKSRTKMTLLSSDLNQFKTKESDFISSAAPELKPVETESKAFSDELHDAIFGGEDSETKEDIIAATKLSLEESPNDLQLEADIANYNAEYELKTEIPQEVPSGLNEAVAEKTEEIVQQPAESETEALAANETAQADTEKPVQKVESEPVKEKPAETETSKKHGLLSAAAATAPAAGTQASAEPAESTGFFQHSDDDSIILPLDDFDTLFKDCDSNE
ncbi:MAG: hypothetical protein J6P07_01245, partial [Spirochaetaceae bacterium]|nr:hypothetical protein [Spirochaetaceae bacterium]